MQTTCFRELIVVCSPGHCLLVLESASWMMMNLRSLVNNFLDDRGRIALLIGLGLGTPKERCRRCFARERGFSWFWNCLRGRTPLLLLWLLPRGVFLRGSLF